MDFPAFKRSMLPFAKIAMRYHKSSASLPPGNFRSSRCAAPHLGRPSLVLPIETSHSFGEQDRWTDDLGLGKPRATDFGQQRKQLFSRDFKLSRPRVANWKAFDEIYPNMFYSKRNACCEYKVRRKFHLHTS